MNTHIVDATIALEQEITNILKHALEFEGTLIITIDGAISIKGEASHIKAIMGFLTDVEAVEPAYDNDYNERYIFGTNQLLAHVKPTFNRNLEDFTLDLMDSLSL